MSNIIKTSVEERNLTQLIQRLGRDCSPTQFVREYTMNSIEAIQRTGTEGVVIVDVNWSHADLLGDEGVYKISFTDNGDGMTCEEMRTHLNNLSSSGDNENTYENYGMGAKIAALTRNHYGIIYESWKNGDGNRIFIHYDEDEGAYGIKPISTEGGHTEWCSPLDDYMKPDVIVDHGTRVTLLGMTEEEDNMMPPPDARGGRDNWLYQYLNTRFFELPDKIQVKVRVAYYRDRDNTKHNHLRTIRGQKATLDGHATESGVVYLSDAKLYWWILNDNTQGHGREYVRGHTGCINQNEIFDLADGRSNKASGFGVIFGKENVVLYVEPKGAHYVQGTARTRLVQRDGTALPWSRWQDEFREKMPKEIDAYMKKLMGAAENASHSESIKERLKGIREFFRLSRYRRAVGGHVQADPESETKGKIGQGKKKVQTKGGLKRVGTGNGIGTLEALLLASRKNVGVEAEEISPDYFPEFVWVSSHDSTRGDEDLEDRAAEYLEKDNLIRANADFQGFVDVIEYFAKIYDAEVEAEKIIRGEVQEAFEQHLTEVVIGALALKNRPRWNPEQFGDATSQEALTTAVMCRYHLINQIKRSIGSKLGKVRKLVSDSI